VHCAVESVLQIRDEGAARRVLLSPDAFCVTVEGGVVRIQGTESTAADAESVTRYLRRVPGVVDVTSELDWREDRPSGRALLRVAP